MVTRAGEPGWSVRELEHTADAGFEVEAPSWPVLLERAALALAAMIVDVAGVAPREAITIAVEAATREDLLHDWLHAILVHVQTRGFVPCEIDVRVVRPGRLEAGLRGEPLDPRCHTVIGEIKAVTWHGLAVEECATGLRVRVILDV
jgi:SHS2 domain-containing protein